MQQRGKAIKIYLNDTTHSAHKTSCIIIYRIEYINNEDFGIFKFRTKNMKYHYEIVS